MATRAFPREPSLNGTRFLAAVKDTDSSERLYVSIALSSPQLDTVIVIPRHEPTIKLSGTNDD